MRTACSGMRARSRTRCARRTTVLIEAVQTAALLHDIGKLAIPDRLLHKPGPLTREEYEQVKLHAAIGADMLEGIDFAGPLARDRAPSSRELGRHRLPRRAVRRSHPVRRPAARDRRLLRRVDVGASLPEGAAARSRAQDDRRAARHELRSSGLRRLPARRAEPSRHHCPAAAGRGALVRVPAAHAEAGDEPRATTGPDLQDTAARLARLRAGRGAVRRRRARGLGDGGALRPGRAVRACCSGSPC